MTERNMSGDAIIPESNLALPYRKIWIVTTAALPWRTGTSINPLLRALYLSRGRPSKSVCLVIPWLENEGDRDSLYGDALNDESSNDGELGRNNQEKWIRNFASNGCGMAEEERAIKIMFYRAAYLRSFGSIFATEDICALVPDKEADVAILEEPEHLNWFRVPGAVESTVPVPSNQVESLEMPGKRQNAHLDAETNDGTRTIDSTSIGESTTGSVSCTDQRRLNAQLGWMHKFRFVVGICHTNYAAYVKRYGIGASIIAAPVITAFNSLVVRAYCHRVIKLSGVLQSFAPEKEVTCNVHGVRPDFLTLPANDSQYRNVPSTNGGEIEAASGNVYYIGKLLWAKGFDLLLEIQDRYRKRTGDYFPIDIYGGGPDERPIVRAFHGRLSQATDDAGLDVAECGTTGRLAPVDPVFNNPKSLRTQRIELLKRQEQDQCYTEDKDPVRFKCLGFEVTANYNDFPDNIEYVVETAARTTRCRENAASPLNIIGDISTSSISTGIATSVAAYKVGDAAVKNVLSLVFSPEQYTGEDDDKKTQSTYMFDPPQSRFELRWHPIPAHFLGVMDHALLKNKPQKVFLNPSVSEVLCTTTAEALAMGKFAIIPRHSSNLFFEQFSNALLYNSLDDAVDKLIFALKHEPDPLCEESARLLSWEAATERLIQACAITHRENEDRKRSDVDKSDEHIAWLHSEASKTTHFLSIILPGQGR